MVRRLNIVSKSVYQVCWIIHWIDPRFQNSSFLIQILTKNLYPAPVTHIPSRERISVWRLPEYSRTYWDHGHSSTEDLSRWGPPYTTIHKFCQRIWSTTFTRPLNRLMKMFYDWGERINCITVDSSGFSSSFASHYYSWRTGKTRKRFLKLSISINTNRQIIAVLKISQHPVYDVQNSEKILKQYHWVRNSDL